MVTAPEAHHRLQELQQCPTNVAHAVHVLHAHLDLLYTEQTLLISLEVTQRSCNDVMHIVI